VVDDAQLHLGDLLVDALDELEHKVNQFFLLESLQVLVANQEREVILGERGFFSQNLELVGAECHESFQHVG